MAASVVRFGSWNWPREQHEGLSFMRRSFPRGYCSFPAVHFIRSKPEWGELSRRHGTAVSPPEQPVAPGSEWTVNKIPHGARDYLERTEKRPASPQQPAHAEHGIRSRMNSAIFANDDHGIGALWVNPCSSSKPLPFDGLKS
jgi:hypothetical protein